METGAQLFVYHVSEAAAAKAGLERLKNGFERPIPLSAAGVGGTKRGVMDSVGRAMANVPPFNQGDIDTVKQIAGAGSLKMIPAGGVLAKEGTSDTMMYLIVDGEVEIAKGGKVVARRERGWIGEGALFGEERNATVRAIKPTSVIALDAIWHRELLRTTGITERLAALRQMRSIAYEKLAGAFVMDGTSGEQVDALLSIASQVEAKPGEAIVMENAVDQDVFFVLDGEAFVEARGRGVVARVGHGSFVGEMAIINDAPRSATVRAKGAMSLLKFPRAALDALMDEVPTIRLRLMALTASRQSANTAALEKFGSGRIVVRHVAPDGSVEPAVKSGIASNNIADYVTEPVEGLAVLGDPVRAEIIDAIRALKKGSPVSVEELNAIAQRILAKYDVGLTQAFRPAGSDAAKPVKALSGKK